MGLPLSRMALNRKALKLRLSLYRLMGGWPVSALRNRSFKQLPIYCISLASKTERRNFIADQVANLGLESFQFVDAVDAKKLDIGALEREGVYNETLAIRYHGRSLSPEEVACSLSHGKAYERIVAHKHPYALIIEDDAMFVPHRIDQLSLSDVPDDFDVFFLNSFRTQEPPKGRIRGNIYKDTSYAGSTAAYLLTRSAAEQLWQAHKPVIHAADGLVGRALKLENGVVHEFRQRGVSISLTGYFCYPDCIYNGSVLNFTSTTVW